MPAVMAIGVALLDEILTIPVPLKPGEKHRASRAESVPGGNAVNAAIAISRLGGTAHLMARIGDDDTGRQLLDRLNGLGIETSGVHCLPGLATVRSSIIIEPGGDRTIVNYLDPRMPDRPDWLPQSLPAGIGAVMGDTRWETGAGHVFDLARKARIPAVFDGDRAPADRTLLKRASHVIFSATGLRETSGIEDLQAGLLALQQETTAFLAVTDGAEGVLALLPDGLWHVPSLTVEAVDTLGAGDVWHGAFTWALTEAMPLLTALGWANITAALKCQRQGGSMGAPARAEVEAALPKCPAPHRLAAI